MSAHIGPLRIRYSWGGIQIYRLTTSQRASIGEAHGLNHWLRHARRIKKNFKRYFPTT